MKKIILTLHAFASLHLGRGGADIREQVVSLVVGAGGDHLRQV